MRIFPFVIDLKLKKYVECIHDCDECLKLEPANVKAMLRKCEAFLATNQKNDAYKQYSQILKIDPENAIAKKALKNISLRYDKFDEFLLFYISWLNFFDKSGSVSMQNFVILILQT